MRPDEEAEPPKLRSVTRWLERMEAAGDAAGDSIVWIDDVLGPNVKDWASGHQVPVLLQKPVPDQGLLRRNQDRPRRNAVYRRPTARPAAA